MPSQGSKQGKANQTKDAAFLMKLVVIFFGEIKRHFMQTSCVYLSNVQMKSSIAASQHKILINNIRCRASVLKCQPKYILSGILVEDK